MRIAASVKGTNIFRNVHLVDSNHHLSRPLSLILKPSIRHTEVQISSHFQRRISPQEDFPVVVHSLKNRGEVDIQLRKVLKAHRVEKDLHFLSLGVSDHLSGNVDAIGLIEDVKTEMIGKISVSDLFVGAESALDDMFDLFASDLHEERLTPGTLRMTSSTSIWQ